MSTGTGFFYGLNRTQQSYVPVIVTNRHVVAGATTGRFLLTLQDDHGNPIIGKTKGFEVQGFEHAWVPHPNPDVDLCVMPIGPLISQADQEGVKFFYTTLDSDLIPTATEVQDMVGLESVVMVGYPDGLWDKVNNLPIFRKGMLATDYKYGWNGKSEFLIDAACFPGSSGSPVLLFDI